MAFCGSSKKFKKQRECVGIYDGYSAPAMVVDCAHGGGWLSGYDDRGVLPEIAFALVLCGQSLLESGMLLLASRCSLVVCELSLGCVFLISFGFWLLGC